MEVFYFFAGLVSYYYTSPYPFVIMTLILWLKPDWRFVVSFFLAILYASLHQFQVQDKGFPQNLQLLKKAHIEGEVVSVPAEESQHLRFQFLVHRLNQQKAEALLLLQCYEDCPLVKAGERWALTAKLKRPRNLNNPGSFDYEQWLSARHITWLGYFKSRDAARVEKATKKNFLIIREHLALSLKRSFSSDPQTLGIIEALSLGLTEHISKPLWALFRETGTTHLMVISGAHIGLVAGFIFKFVHWLWTRFPRFCLYLPAPLLGRFWAFLAGLFYAFLAGFAIPAQRAFFVLFFVCLQDLFGFRFTSWQIWRQALFLVLLYEPHAVLFPGFYLSFIAVAILFLVGQRFSYRGFRGLFITQLACLCGLMPLTLFWFSYGSLTGLFANVVAIPFVGFILVPLSLLSLFLLQCVDLPWFCLGIEKIVQVFLVILNGVGHFSWLNITVPLLSITWVLADLFALLMLFFFPIKRLLPFPLIWVIASFFPALPVIKKGEVSIHILDVGQGLAVLVRTAEHSLVYDTGKAFRQGSDMGTLVLIPFFKTLGLKHLDKVVISHPDLDHRGGLASLGQVYPIGELLVDDPSLYHNAQSCHHYAAWNWDGIQFRFFPLPTFFSKKNNHSCILQIEAKGRKLLLTGDIEKTAENYLITSYGEALRSEILLLPHHGSKSSSSLAFLQMISPQYALLSVGFDNPYHLPHQDVLKRLKAYPIPVLSTEACGMITVKLAPKAGRLFCKGYKAYWEKA